MPAVIGETGSLDASLFTFRLGPTLFYDVSPHFGLTGGIGPAFGFITEVIPLRRTRFHRHRHSVTHKGQVQQHRPRLWRICELAATYHAEDSGDIYIGVQYMPMTGSTFSKDGREASVNHRPDLLHAGVVDLLNRPGHAPQQLQSCAFFPCSFVWQFPRD